MSCNTPLFLVLFICTDSGQQSGPFRGQVTRFHQNSVIIRDFGDLGQAVVHRPGVGQVPHPAVGVRPRQPASKKVSKSSKGKHACIVQVKYHLNKAKKKHLWFCGFLQVNPEWNKLPVAEEEMVEEDGDLQLGEIIAGAEPGAEPEGEEGAGPRRVALKGNKSVQIV